jgi:hypothetical protein
LNEVTVLLPFPIHPRELVVEALRLQEALKSHTVEELAEDRLATIYGWDSADSEVKRRLYRSLSLVYSREELRLHALASIKQLQGLLADPGAT